ncbi:MAG: GAF domain-containing protein, partial [Microcoleaceae cyanobacterium]
MHFNQACEKITGYTFAEVEGKYVWDLFLIPAEIKPVQEQWANILSGEYPNYYRNYWCDRQGDLHLIDWSSTVLLDEKGEINYIIGTGIDVTESHERAEKEQLINDIAQQIRSSLNLSEILDNTVNELRKFLNCDRVVVFDFAEDYSGLIIAESVAEGYLSLLGRTIVDTCFQTGGIAFVSYTNGKKWAVNDVEKVGLPPCYLELLTSFQVKSSLVVPILLKEEKNAKLYLWGLLIAHQCGQTREWQEQELECLDQLSVQLSIAIQQSLFYEQAQSEIREKKEAELALSKTNELLETAVYKRTQRLSAINAQLQNEIRERRQAEMAVRLQNRKSELFYQITLKIRRSLKLPDILQTTVDEVRQMLLVDRVLIYQIFPNGTGRTIAESLAVDCTSILNIPFPVEVFPQEYQEAYAKGKVRAIANVEHTYQDKTPCLVDFLASLGVKAKLVVPISINEKLWGLLIAHHCQCFRYWTNFEIELLQQLGNQVGIALAQSQMWLSLQEKEKRYRTIVETATEGIWMIDCDDYTNFVNQKMADMLQYNISQMNN